MISKRTQLANVFLLIDLTQRIRECFLSHQFPVIRYSNNLEIHKLMFWLRPHHASKLISLLYNLKSYSTPSRPLEICYSVANNVHDQQVLDDCPTLPQHRGLAVMDDQAWFIHITILVTPLITTNISNQCTV